MAGVGAVVGRDKGLADRAEFVLQNDRALIAEAQDRARGCARGLGAFCSLQHGRHADAAAEKDRLCAERRDVKPVAERSEHVEFVTLPAGSQPLGAAALDLEHDVQRAVFSQADRDRAAEQVALPACDVYKLAALRRGRDLRRVQHEPV